MTRAPRVFTWSDGLHAYTVAVSSKAKALAAWGVGPTLPLTVGTYIWSGLMVLRVHPDRSAVVPREATAPAPALVAV